MNALERFLLYNLAASLAAGLLAWAVVMLALRLLRARTAFLYASFLALPLVKSILVLLGIGLILPGLRWFAWQPLALLPFPAAPPQDVAPLLAGWALAAGLTYRWLVRRARRALLAQAAAPTGAAAARLDSALERVVRAYQTAPCCQAGETACCLSDQIPAQPRLLVADGLRSPIALVEGGAPVVIFPHGLLALLDDEEIALALAHELNHFALRKPGGWSAGNLRLLALISPVALLLAESLHREEEKACDDLAVRMLGQPELYASMLMKSYQFARGKHAPRWQPALLGARPFLSERIERLLEPQPVGPRWYQSGLVTWPVWGLLMWVLFFAR